MNVARSSLPLDLHGHSKWARKRAGEVGVQHDASHAFEGVSVESSCRSVGSEETTRREKYCRDGVSNAEDIPSMVSPFLHVTHAHPLNTCNELKSKILQKYKEKWFEKGIKAALHQRSSCRSRFYDCLSGRKTDHNHTWSRFPTFLHTYAYGHT